MDGPKHMPGREKPLASQGFRGADDGIRTRDPHLGKATSGVHDVGSRIVICRLV
jgi:hypothetical protein